MGPKIEAFLDCVSPYSYFAFCHLLKNRETLGSYGIEIDFIPIFLGGVNHGSGNKPPWSLEAKAKYSRFDGARAQKYFGVPPNFKTPEPFPIVSLLPQRCMGYIKDSFSRAEFEAAFKEMWHALWTRNENISDSKVLAGVLSTMFNAQQTKDILAAASSPKYKQRLNDSTQTALERGAFGAPWFWVRNAEGKEEPFFGSDRFHFMWEFLGIQWSDVAIAPRPAVKL